MKYIIDVTWYYVPWKYVEILNKVFSNTGRLCKITTWSIPPAAARTHLHQITLLWRKGGWKSAITPGPWALKFQARPSQWKTPAKSKKKTKDWRTWRFITLGCNVSLSRLASPNTCSEGFSNLAISVTWPSKKKSWSNRIPPAKLPWRGRSTCPRRGVSTQHHAKVPWDNLANHLDEFSDLPSWNKLILGHLPH